MKSLRHQLTISNILLAIIVLWSTVSVLNIKDIAV